MVDLMVNQQILALGLAIVVPLLTCVSAQHGPGIAPHSGSGEECVFRTAAAGIHINPNGNLPPWLLHSMKGALLAVAEIAMVLPTPGHQARLGRAWLFISWVDSGQY